MQRRDRELRRLQQQRQQQEQQQDQQEGNIHANQNEDQARIAAPNENNVCFFLCKGPTIFLSNICAHWF